MKDFRTTVSISPASSQISLQTLVLTAGSCFADAIGLRLKQFKFDTLVNPFGVIYNPVSIHKALTYGILNKLPDDDHYLIHQQVHRNYDFHSQFADLQKNTLTSSLNKIVNTAHHFLKNAEWAILTYGTAWVYTRKESGEVVANCHKMPAHLFSKSLLTEKEIVGSFGIFYERLLEFNPDIKIILTLSPVRHIKDTLEMNSVSKSILRVACHHIAHDFKNVDYFPAYEIMMDDLRDYRFYKADMLHPTEVAEDYIWEKFAERYLAPDAQSFISRWKNIRTALYHKPFHATSAAHQQFLKQTLKKLEELKPAVNVDEEIAHIKLQISDL
jgi:hypothetical protein